jgi:hypothetical protein
MKRGRGREPARVFERAIAVPRALANDSVHESAVLHVTRRREDAHKPVKSWAGLPRS